jgi:hypothetical protein
MIKKNTILILAVTTLGCVSTAFHKAISGFMQGKGKGSVSLSVQKNMIKCILFQKK